MELERLLLRSDSVEQFLKAAPRELRSNYTFVYESRSPFAGSITPDFPRVVLFTPDAKTLVTFTGQPRAVGADIVEAFYFDDASARFETASYILPKARRERGSTVGSEIAACNRCHGDDARPVFDSYPLWPGFYGSVKDSFLQGLELEKFQHFQATTSKSGVYRFLIPPRGSRVAPYVEPEKLVAGAIEADPAQFRFMPNTRLGMALTELNRKRLFRKLQESSRYMASEKRLLAVLLECGVGGRREDVEASIRAQLASEDADRLDRLHVPRETSVAQSLSMQEMKFVPALSQIVEISETLQVPMTDWSMSLTPSSFAFYDGILSGLADGRSFYLKEDFIYEMLKRLAHTDSRYLKFFRVNSSFAEYDYPFGHRVDLSLARGACPLL